MSLKDVEAKIKKLAKTKIKAGWLGDAENRHEYPDGTSVAYVATIQEYGYVGGGINIPPRPFIRPAEADHKKEWGKLAGSVASQYLAGTMELDHAGDIVGQAMEDGILDKIVNGTHAPLSQITLLLRKWRKEGKTINKSTVEEARRYLEAHPNAKVSGNATPLNDTGLMIASLSHNVK